MSKQINTFNVLDFYQTLAELNLKIDMLSKEVASLNKKLPSKISAKVAGEILELTEGTLSSVVCLAEKENTCPRKALCPTLPMWEEFDQIVHDFFYGKKLSDLIRTDPQQPK